MTQITQPNIDVDFIEPAASVLPGASYATDGEAGLAYLVSTVLSIALVIAVLVVFGLLIIAAFDWITAGGDKGKIQSAQQKFVQAIIGLIVLTSVTAVMSFIQLFLGINVLNFGSGGPGSGGGGGGGGNGGGSGSSCEVYATCNGVELPVCPHDICNNPGGQQCLGSQPGNAGIVRCEYLNVPANQPCGYYYWKWETSCNNLGCSGGVCR